MTNSNDLSIVIFVVITGFVVFLVFREFFTWYFKQNQIVKQNDEIIRLLKKIANEPEKSIDTDSNTYENLLQKLNRK